jgi:glycosyltransferase involved in cell wall biosynthesis
VTTTVRILCVTPEGIAGRGGIDRLYYYLRQFHDQQAFAGIEMRYFAARGRARGALWTIAFPWRVAAFVWRLLRWRPDVVHFNFATGGSVFRKYVLLRISRLSGAATIIHFHGQFTAAQVAARSLWSHCFRQLCRRATCIIVLGTFYRRAFIEHVGVPAQRLAILPNGIPDFAAGLALPKPRRPAVELVFLGEVGLRKGTDILVEALARLASGRDAWTCVIAGNGDVARFKSLADDLGLADRVRFTGWIDAEEAHRLARQADVVVLPSRSEALPLTLLEGACAGAALVATSVGEIPDLVHDGVNGLLIEPDPARLAAAIARLIAQRDELARMQVASRRIYNERFRMQAFAGALSALYREVAAAHAAERAGPTAAQSATRRSRG